MKKYLLWLSFSVLFTLTIPVKVIAQLSDIREGFQPMKDIYDATKYYNEHMVAGGSQRVLGAKFGVQLELGAKGQSGYRLFFSGGIAKNLSAGDLGTLIQYQVDIVFFANGIGASAMPGERMKLNIEMRHHLGALLGFNTKPENVWARPLSPNIGDETSVLFDPFDHSFQFGTAFVTGINHARSQQLGFFQLGIGPFNIYYMNDGPPFGKVLLGDTGDKYWTGVGGIGLYKMTEDFLLTSGELRYTRYTGDEPWLYSLSTKMRMNYMPHKKESVQFYNKGRYQYRFGFKGYLFAGLNIYQPRVTDIQQLIHYSVYAFHSNPTDRYFTVFGAMNYGGLYELN